MYDIEIKTEEQQLYSEYRKRNTEMNAKINAKMLEYLNYAGQSYILAHSTTIIKSSIQSSIPLVKLQRHAESILKTAEAVQERFST